MATCVSSGPRPIPHPSHDHILPMYPFHFPTLGHDTIQLPCRALPCSGQIPTQTKAEHMEQKIPRIDHFAFDSRFSRAILR